MSIKRKLSDISSSFETSEPEPKVFKAEQQHEHNMAMKINPPDLKSAKNYECFKNELQLWMRLTAIDKEKQAGCVALTLPNDCPFAKDIRTKVLEKLTVEQLSAPDGMTSLLKVLDDELQQPEIQQAVEDWDLLESRTKSDSESVDEFITDFERLVNRVENKGAILPACVKAFMMLKRIELSHEERLVILSKLDFDKKDNLFNDLKKFLKLFCGKTMLQSKSVDKPSQSQTFEAHFTQRERGRNPKWNRGGGASGAGSGTWQERSASASRAEKGSGTFRKRSNSGGYKKGEKRLNPAGADGNPKRCKSCDSIRHMLSDCPDSWENMKTAYVTELDTVDEQRDEDDVRECYLTEEEPELKRFCIEAKNCAALDSCCTGVVCGEEWLKNFLASMNPADRKKVSGPLVTNSVFKFGNKGQMESQAKYKLPVQIAGKLVEVTTDVIKSDIPMLLSKESMKKMGMILNFINDTVQVGEKFVNLSETSSGHYIIPLLRETQEIHLSMKMPEKKSERLTEVRKIHRQFAHPSKQSLIKLLQEGGLWSQEVSDCVDEIYLKCDICKQTSRVPSRPVVCMPLSRCFNDIIAIDLKLFEGRQILHIIDMFTRYSVSCFVPNKEPKTIVEAIMLNWAAYFGFPSKALLSDNGGEFLGEAMQEMKAQMDIRSLTTGAESPFQNGLCERNHAVIDTMLIRLKIDNPGTNLSVLLKWANLAKNSLFNVHGFSPNQLVFGKNPNLKITSEGTPASLSKVSTEILSDHLRYLKSAREAYIKSESCERIRRALAHKMRASEEKYFAGDEVFYKRENCDTWCGPAKVIFQDGKVVFIRHGAVYVRASVNKIIRRGSGFVTISSSPEVTGSVEPDEKLDKKPEKVVHEELGQDNVSEQSEKSLEPDEISIIKLKKNDEIQLKEKDGTWTTATIMSRAVKLSSNRPDKNWFNVKTDKDSFSVNLDDVPFKMKQGERFEVMFTEMVPRTEHNSDECLAAKKLELEKLESFNAYEIVERQGGESVLGHTWVLVKKNGKIRARLTAKGFQEEIAVRSDSPTISKSTFRIMLAVAVQHRWPVKTTDITSAFLQGDTVDRKIYLKPPKEANLNKSQLWKISKPLYGLNDASRKFYLKVKTILKECGCEQSKYDPALFMYKVDGKLEGLVGTHVDDFLHAGNRNFDDRVMAVINREFKVGKVEEKNFKYTGFQISQDHTSLRVDQFHYVEKIVINVAQKKLKSEPLSEEELSKLRSNVGALQWIARGTRPDIGFESVDLSTKFNRATYDDLHRSVKTLKHIKGDKEKCFFIVPRLGEFNQWRIEVSSDASWANHSDGINSMSGHVVLLVGEGNVSVPINWESGKVQRVVNSTLAAEMLACKKSLEDAFLIKTIVEEILPVTLKINGKVDHKGAVQSINSTNTTADKRVRIDTACIREMIERGEVNSVSHCAGKDQIADCLTKKGADGCQLLNILNSGSMI